VPPAPTYSRQRLLVENLAHAIRKDADDHVGGSASSKRHREHHGSRWKVLRGAFPTSAQPSHNRLKIRYIARPLIFSYFDFLAARTENAVRSARPEKVIAENPKYA